MGFPTPATATGALTSIASSVLGSDQASVSFTGIPATYKHLLLMWLTKSDRVAVNDNLRLRLNNDSGANYDGEDFEGLGATAAAAGSVAQTGLIIATIPAASAGASDPGIGMLIIPSYASTNLNKGVFAPGGASWGTLATQQYASVFTGRWRSSVAVNRIDLTPLNGTVLKVGSEFSLYGMA